MDNTIDIIPLIGKHSPLLSTALEHNKPTEINPENVKTAIEYIIGIVVDKCAEEAKISYSAFDNGSDEGGTSVGVDKQSILNVKNLVKYES